MQPHSGGRGGEPRSGGNAHTCGPTVEAAGNQHSGWAASEGSRSGDPRSWRMDQDCGGAARGRIHACELPRVCVHAPCRCRYRCPLPAPAGRPAALIVSPHFPPAVRQHSSAASLVASAPALLPLPLKFLMKVPLPLPQHPAVRRRPTAAPRRCRLSATRRRPPLPAVPLRVESWPPLGDAWAHRTLAGSHYTKGGDFFCFWNKNVT